MEQPRGCSRIKMGEATLMKKQLDGVALVLFGILLCCAEGEINDVFFHSLSDLPFSIVGLLIGCIGLFHVFRGSQDK